VGTIRQRGPNAWELTVSMGRDAATGRYRRVIRTVYTSSKREAKAALAALEVEVRSGKVGPTDITLAELFERWLEHLRAKGRSEHTLYGYQRYVRRHLLPALGATRLSKLTALDIDRLCADLVAQGLSPATARQAHAILRSALSQGERWGLVGRNVAKLASPPAMPQREQHPPTAAEVRDLLGAASEIDPMLGVYVRLVAATGMRRAEACAIRWDDLDLDAGTLTVARSHVALPGVRIDQPTKTRSVRSILLDEHTVAAVIALRDLLGDLATDGYVFSGDGGASPWRPDSMTARWARVRTRAGVTGTVRLHDLRHWQATQLLDAGLPLPSVAARLGHANGMTTLAIYAHRTVKADEAAAAVIGAALNDE
jgi:integrase